MSEPNKSTTSRKVALEVLARVGDDGAFANLALSTALDRSAMPTEERAFATDLVYGTLRRQRSCDYLVDRFLTSAPPPAARRVLRLGAYQIAFRDDVPDYAAVAATVDAAPKRFRGLVNAVLRKVASTPYQWPDTPTELSYPDWIVTRLSADHGADAAVEMLAAMNAPARSDVRSDGYVQDRASQLVVDLVDAQSGERVADLCAAPGGKATGLATSGAIVVAADLAPQRVGLIASNVQRLESTGVQPVVADALAPPLRPGAFDRVLLDAPCSGLGVLRRRADARWRIEEADVARLATLQAAMVDATVGLLKPGGTYVFSVCTLTSAESIAIDDHIASTHPNLTPDPPDGDFWIPWGRGAMLSPVGPGDGMCAFRYRLR